MAQVFVSSTYLDLKEHRERVVRAIRRLGHSDLAMENFVAEDRRPVDKCLEDVKRCDAYICVVAWRYGFVPSGKEVSITELEYLTALGNGKYCIILLLAEDAPWDQSLVDDSMDRVERFRAHLKEGHVVGFFTGLDDLEARIVEALALWERRAKPSAVVAKEPRVVFEGFTSNQFIAFTVFNPGDEPCIVSDVSVERIYFADVAASRGGVATMGTPIQTRVGLRFQLENLHAPGEVETSGGPWLQEGLSIHTLGVQSVVSLPPQGSASFLLEPRIGRRDPYMRLKPNEGEGTVTFFSVFVQLVEPSGATRTRPLGRTFEATAEGKGGEINLSITAHPESLAKVLQDLSRLRQVSGCEGSYEKGFFSGVLAEDAFSDLFLIHLANSLPLFLSHEIPGAREWSLQILRKLGRRAANPDVPREMVFWEALGDLLVGLSLAIKEFPAENFPTTDVLKELYWAPIPDLYRIRAGRMLVGLSGERMISSLNNCLGAVERFRLPGKHILDLEPELIGLCERVIARPVPSGWVAPAQLEYTAQWEAIATLFLLARGLAVPALRDKLANLLANLPRGWEDSERAISLGYLLAEALTRISGDGGSDSRKDYLPYLSTVLAAPFLSLLLLYLLVGDRPGQGQLLWEILALLVGAVLAIRFALFPLRRYIARVRFRRALRTST